MKRFLWMRSAILASLLWSGIGAVNAGVVIDSTRVIFAASHSDRAATHKTATVKLINNNDYPVLVQVWVDQGDDKKNPEHIVVPFSVPIHQFRMEPQSKDGTGHSHVVRIVHTDEPLPEDRESLFWLNVLEIPSMGKDDVNRLQLAIRQRIKFIYRPKGLEGTPESDAKKLRWDVVPAQGGHGFSLKITNPGAHIAHLANISVLDGDRQFKLASNFVLPKASAVLPIPKMERMPTSGARIEYSFLNDWAVASPVIQSPIGGEAVRP